MLQKVDGRLAAHTCCVGVKLSHDKGAGMIVNVSIVVFHGEGDSLGLKVLIAVMRVSLITGGTIPEIPCPVDKVSIGIHGLIGKGDELIFFGIRGRAGEVDDGAEILIGNKKRGTSADG